MGPSAPTLLAICLAILMVAVHALVLLRVGMPVSETWFPVRGRWLDYLTIGSTLILFIVLLVFLPAASCTIGVTLGWNVMFLRLLWHEWERCIRTSGWFQPIYRGILVLLMTAVLFFALLLPLVTAATSMPP